MRLLAVGLALTMVTACGAEREQGTPTTGSVEATTTLAPASTTTSTLFSPTLREAEEVDDPGTESIGVTEKVTIVVTDPENG